MSEPNRVGDEQVAVIIVNYRTPELTLSSLAALEAERARLPELKVLVVDGASEDGSAEILARSLVQRRYEEWVTFLPLPFNGGFGWANNEAIVQLLQSDNPPEFLHLLNPDAQVEPGAVAALVKCLHIHPMAGAAGSQLLDPAGVVSGSAFNDPSVRGEFSRGARTGFFDRLVRVPAVAVTSSSSIEVDWTTGASVMFRTTALKQVGFFDEGFFLYHEEIELMWRLRQAGWKIMFAPASCVRHVGGAATGLKGRVTTKAFEPRMPIYWYRSRARYFALTRGLTGSMAAYAAWIVGYPIWAIRRLLKLGQPVKPFDHEFRDHLVYGLPRLHDRISAVRRWGAARATKPAWMERGW